MAARSSHRADGARLVHGCVVRPPADAPRVQDYFRILSRGWLVILSAAVLSALVVMIGDRLVRDPVFVASTQLFALVPGDAQTHAAYEGNRAASVRMDTYAQLATSSIVTQRTIADLGLEITPEDLANRISVRSVPDTLSQFSYPMSVLMNVQVSGGDPKGTVVLANAVARNIVTASQEVEWNGQQSGPALVLIDDAKVAHENHESWVSEAALGAGLGLSLSCFLVLVVGLARDLVLDHGQVGFVARSAARAGGHDSG